MKNIFLFVVLMLIFSCTNKYNNNDTSRIVLKIDNLSITEYEYSQSFAKDNLDINEIKSEKLRDKQVEKWKLGYLNKIYLVVDALNKGYGEEKTVINKVERYANYMLAKENGYLWNYVEKPKLDFSTEEIKDAYKKRATEYYVESIVFLDTTYYYKNREKMRLLGDNQLNNFISQFDQKKVKYQIFPARYPYIELITFPNLIDTLTTDRNIGPFFHNDLCFYFNILKKEVIKQKPFKECKDEVLNELINYRSRTIVNENVKKILDSAKPVYYEDNLSKYLRMNYVYSNKGVLDLGYLTTPDLPLVKYYHNNSAIQIGSHHFWRYRHNFYLVMDLKNINDIKFELNNLIVEEAVSEEAKKLKLDTLSTFLLEIKSYRNKLALTVYQDSIKAVISPASQEELSDYYRKNQNSFLGSDNAIFSLYSFNSYENAVEAKFKIRGILKSKELNKSKDIYSLSGINNYIESESISRHNTSYPKEFIGFLFKLSPEFPSEPYKLGNEHIIAVKKSESGTAIKPFDEVKEEIERKIRNEKFQQIKSAMIQELKKKYKVEIDLTDKIEL